MNFAEYVSSFLNIENKNKNFHLFKQKNYE